MNTTGKARVPGILREIGKREYEAGASPRCQVSASHCRRELFNALLMSVLENGLILMRVDVYWQNIVIGAIIILTVGFDQYRRTKISAQN